MKEIAFRNDSDQRAVVVDYGQSTLVGFQQKTNGIEQRRIRFVVLPALEHAQLRLAIPIGDGALPLVQLDNGLQMAGDP